MGMKRFNAKRFKKGDYIYTISEYERLRIVATNTPFKVISFNINDTLPLVEFRDQNNVIRYRPANNYKLADFVDTDLWRAINGE